MDINLYIEGLRQSQEKTSRQKDILDTWEELYDKDICLNLQWQLGVLVEEEMSGSVKT